MKDSSYVDDSMDIKKYVICLLGKLPWLLGAVAGGAVLGLIVYAAVRTVPESEREYQAFAKVYLDFAADETGEVYQAYNGYTWNDLMAADPIMDLILGSLSGEYTRDEVEASIKAEILSDIRLLTVTVTTHSAVRTDEIMNAAVRALETYGTQAKEFLGINAVREADAALVVADSRMAQAALLGAFLGFLLSLLSVSLFYVVDDRIFVAGDVRKVTDLSFLGYSQAEGDFRQDYENNLAYLREKRGEVRICELKGNKALSQEELQEMRKVRGVVLSLPFGKIHGAFLAYVLEQMKTQDCVPCGVAIWEADPRFLQKYYGKVFPARRERLGML